MNEELDRFAAAALAPPAPMERRAALTNLELTWQHRFFRRDYKEIDCDLRLQLTYPHET